MPRLPTSFGGRTSGVIVVGYAMSESPYGLVWAHGTRPYGTLGSARQHPVLGVINEVRAVSESGADLGPGASGELLLRNPVVTPGYWGMPEETQRALTADGWLHTGDLVTRDEDGQLALVSNHIAATHEWLLERMG